MRKIITVFLFAFFIFGTLMQSSVFAAPKAKKNQTKHKIEFTTKDKFILVGDLYLAKPKTDKPLVIALHSFALNSSSWQSLAQQLRLKGYNVLAMDLRGHGRSVYNENLKLKSRFKFKNSDWQKLPSDVSESINYIKSNYPNINCNEVIIIGADLGASAGIIAGETLKKKPVKFVMISPMLNFKGLYIPVKVANYRETKFLVLLSKTDKILFNFYTEIKPVIKQYPQGGPGVQLLKANSSAIADIVNFIAN